MEEATGKSADTEKRIRICEWEAKLTDSCCLVSL